MILLRNSAKPVDATMKLIASLIFVLGVILINRLFLLFLCIGVVLCCILFIGLPIGIMLRRLRSALPFLCFMLLIVPFQIPGKPLFSIHIGFTSLIATEQGVLFSLMLWLKSLNSIMVLLLLTETTPLKELQRALYTLRVPDLLLQIISFTFRYFTIIHQEFLRIERAQRARGFQKGKSLMNTYTLKIIAQSIGHVFFRALDRSERIYWSMAARGYNRTPMIKKTGPLCYRDCNVALASFCFTCFMIWIDKGGIL